MQTVKKQDIAHNVSKLLESAVDEIFTVSHQQAKTKTGDISPDQHQKLEYLKQHLSELITEQVWQNVDIRYTLKYQPIIVEKYGSAYAIDDDGYLICFPVLNTGEIEYESYGPVCWNVDSVDIEFIREIHEITGWVYITDYKLDTSL